MEKKVLKKDTDRYQGEFYKETNTKLTFSDDSAMLLHTTETLNSQKIKLTVELAQETGLE